MSNWKKNLVSRNMVAISAIGAAFFLSGSLVKADPVAEKPWAVAQFCLAERVKFPVEANRVSGVSLGLLNMVDSVTGFQLGLFNGGTIDGWADYTSTAVPTNDDPLFPEMAGGIRGIQIGGVNQVIGTVQGAQFSLLMNTAGRYSTGLQVSGGFNLNKEDTRTVQIALFMNTCSRDSSGVQIGAINICEGRYVGIQIGIYNRVKDLYGLQIGIVNEDFKAQSQYLPLIRWVF